MYETFVWWMIVQIIGAIALPLTFLIFSNLPDRGLPFAKPMGILILSYVLWLGGLAHLWPNSRGSMVALLAALGLGSLFVLSRCRDDLLAFVRRNKRTILIQEGLFAAAFLLWAFVRAYNPEIRATEQPMDFGFLNAVYRSEYFPPNDPWLAGYSISYYYFGYLMMATLAKLSGLATSVAYNLSLSMLFGLIAVGAYSIAYNLVAIARSTAARSDEVSTPTSPSERNRKRVKGKRVSWTAPVVGVIGALFVVGIGNLEGALELFRAHGLGSSDLWRWIGINNAFVPYFSAEWFPTENWWWWRATRVINSLALTVDAGGAIASVNDQIDYTITEFPFFSFLLGDMHPHVMALPFNLLAVALSLDVLLRGKDISLAWLRDNPWRPGLYALLLGALGFLNTWDFPTYAALFLASTGAGMLLAGRRIDWRLLAAYGAVVLAVGIVGLAAYSPFYIGFQSQASGILPVLGPGTQFLHYAIVWGLFLTILVAFVTVLFVEIAKRSGKAVSVHWWPLLVVLVPLSVWVATVAGASAAGFLKDVAAADFVRERLWRLLPILGLLAATTFALDLTLRERGRRAKAGERPAGDGDIAVIFALLMAAVGFVLTLGTELFFIRDVFGSRMNTVFKLYYQAWVLLALASSFGLYYVSLRLLGKNRRKPLGMVWLAIVAVLIVAAFVYPLASVFSKTGSFAGPPTLDGIAYVNRENPGEYQAIQWLIANAADGAVIVEATGGQYSEYARVATRTGLPNILGWAGHEWQWRGSDKAYVGRAEDIDTIYRSADRGQVMALLAKYDVDYVYAGHLERNKYGQAALDKFASIMDTAFTNNTTAIYKVRR